jgi:Thioredoxin
VKCHVQWCPTCGAQEPVIRESMAQSKYKDLTTFIIDFDTDTALLKAYNVRVQSTLIVLTGKHEEGRSVGDTSREGIERLLNTHFPGNDGVQTDVVDYDESPGTPANRASGYQLELGCHRLFFATDSGGDAFPS